MGPVEIPVGAHGWIVVLATLATLVIIGGLLLKPARWLAKWARRTGHLMDDFIGEEAHGGKPATPGLMERLGSAEATAAETKRSVALILAEISPNGGDSSSMRDTMHRIEVKVVNLGEHVNALGSDVDQLKQDRLRFRGSD